MAKKTTPLSTSIRSVSGASLTVDADVKSTQVLPVGPTVSRQDSASKRRLRDTHTPQLSFLQAFGALGVPMALILVLCMAWTAWLIFVSLAPSEAANWLVNTADCDHGQFWLIIDTNPALTMAGVVCLVIVSFSYLFVILKMLLWREKILTPATIRGLERRLLDSWSRWTNDGPCPRLIFIDVNKSPKTYEEWNYPPDAYAALKAVSRFGVLESIQVINRHLLEFPEELRSCSKLKSIQLMYTSVEIVPQWAGEFKHLETLCV
ncbi:hypothetical protein PF003_g10941 [Phytophthora fragariae]|nr:hypothetical protein PF003_g10941 [Phytophthora fragariae]